MKQPPLETAALIKCFPLITNIYQTVDHTVDMIVICISLSLHSQLCSWRASTETAINSNSLELQLFTCHTQQSAQQ